MEKNAFFLQCLCIRLQPSAGESNISINFQTKITELQGTPKTLLFSFSCYRAITWEREIFILRVISFLYSAPFWWYISQNRCLFLGQEHLFSTYIPKSASGIAIKWKSHIGSLASVSSQSHKWASGEGWEPVPYHLVRSSWTCCAPALRDLGQTFIQRL